MKTWICLIFVSMFGFSDLLHLDAAEVTSIAAVHRHGQTFVTWKDVAAGEAGAKYRYQLYRSDDPITAENLANAELCYGGILNNSAKLYGSAFTLADRLDPEKPYTVIEEDGQPLPPWSGLAVRTVRTAGSSYYAIVALDEQQQPVGKIVPGKSATTVAIKEQTGPIQPIKLYDSAKRDGPSVGSTQISGEQGLPLTVKLHGSQSRGGGAGGYGDYYLYFGTPEMGYRDGLPGVFSIIETRRGKDKKKILRLQLRDALEHPNRKRAMETYWFGYQCVPHGASHAEPRVYPYTENQIVWITQWVIKHYGVNPNEVDMGGRSSGAVGSFLVGFRHPQLYAAVFPVCGRLRRVPAIALDGKFDREKGAMMQDGITPYYDRADASKLAAQRHDDLPFVGWACGRHDGWATWPEQIAMVKAMTANHHGFAFSWNNGNHSSGGRAMDAIKKYYPEKLFAKDRSYPAFGNSSLDNDMGSGDANSGDLVGGINLGFRWSDVSDAPDRWSIQLSNELAEKVMTVDVTPRRCQQFKLKPGEECRWTNSAGGSGKVVVDAWGLVTVPQVKIPVGQSTQLTIERQGTTIPDGP